MLVKQRRCCSLRPRVVDTSRCWHHGGLVCRAGDEEKQLPDIGEVGRRRRALASHFLQPSDLLANHDWRRVWEWQSARAAPQYWAESGTCRKSVGPGLLQAESQTSDSWWLGPNCYDNWHRKFERILLPPAAESLNNRGLQMTGIGKIEFGKNVLEKPRKLLECKRPLSGH